MVAWHQEGGVRFRLMVMGSAGVGCEDRRKRSSARLSASARHLYVWAFSRATKVAALLVLQRHHPLQERLDLGRTAEHKTHTR